MSFKLYYFFHNRERKIYVQKYSKDHLDIKIVIKDLWSSNYDLLRIKKVL